MKFTATLAAALSLVAVAAAAPLESRGPSHTAPATYYYQGGNAGSCGQYHSDNDFVVAMPGWMHNSKNCGSDIRVQYNGKTIRAKIADTCPGCEGYHIDLSSAAFAALAPHSKGQIQVTWNKI